MTSIYLEGDYLANNPSWHSEDSPTKARWIDTILKRNHRDPKTIVEVGCGAGGILHELQKLRPEATYAGYEISPDIFPSAEAKTNDRLTFHHQDILQTDAKGFDCLMLIDVFEHVPDYMGFIRGLKDRAELKLFHIPLDMSVQGMLRGYRFMEVRESLGHIHYFFKDTALATVRDCGYEVIDHMYTASTQELPNQKFATKLLNIPRKIVDYINKDFSVRLFGGYSLLVLAR